MSRFALGAAVLLLAPAVRAADPPDAARRVEELRRQLKSETAAERVRAADDLGRLGPAAAGGGPVVGLRGVAVRSESVR